MQPRRGAQHPLRAVQSAGKLSVLMIAHAFPPTLGGVESHVADVAAHLSERGHAVTCLVGGARGHKDRRRDYTVYRHPRLGPRSLLAAGPDELGATARVVADVLERHNTQVVHVHNAHHFSEHLADAVFDAVRLTPHRLAPVLINGVHDHVGNHVRPGVLDAFPWDHILYVSEFTKRALPSRRPSTVRHLGIDLDRFRAAGRRHRSFARLERPIVFHPARLLGWKGVEQGLEAFIEIRRELGAGTLVMCASNDVVDVDGEVGHLRAALEDRARRAGIEEHVRYLALSPEDMPSAYRSSDLVWYPTTGDEPFGLVPLEAAACGIPVVLTPSGGMTETTVPGVTAVVVPKGDSAALARGALTVLRDPALRLRLADRASGHVRRFDIGAYVEHLEGIYAACLCSTGGEENAG